MRAFDIPFWVDGAKIRRPHWGPSQYIYFTQGQWHSHNFSYGVMLHSDLFDCTDWEPYVPQPKKVKRKVTLYRAIYRQNDGTIFMSEWVSYKRTTSDPQIPIIGHETREIEVDE